MATDIKKILTTYKIACNSHDLDKTSSFFADDCILEDVALGIVSYGKEAVTSFYIAMFTDFPDLKFEIKSIFAVGDLSVMEWVMAGTHTHSTLTKNSIPATGKTFAVRGTSVYQFNEGKLTKETAYYNLMTFLQQVGLMPGQPK